MATNIDSTISLSNGPNSQENASMASNVDSINVDSIINPTIDSVSVSNVTNSQEDNTTGISPSHSRLGRASPQTNNINDLQDNPQGMNIRQTRHHDTPSSSSSSSSSPLSSSPSPSTNDDPRNSHRIFTRFDHILWEDPLVSLVVDADSINLATDSLRSCRSCCAVEIVSTDDFLANDGILNESCMVFLITSESTNTDIITKALQMSRDGLLYFRVIVGPTSGEAKYLPVSFFAAMYTVTTADDLRQVYVDSERFLGPCLPSAPPGYRGKHVYEHSGVSSTDVVAWTVVTTQFKTHPQCSECIMSARIVGTGTNKHRYAVMFLTPDSPLWDVDLDAAFVPFTLLKVVNQHTSIKDDEYDKDDNPVNGQYTEKVVTGCSIGPAGIRSACTFGGYITIDGVVYGMSACHGTCPTTCKAIKLENEPGCLIVCNSDLDHEYKSKSVDELVELSRRRREKAAPHQVSFHDGLVDSAIRTRESFLQMKDTDRTVGNVRMCSGYSKEGGDWSVMEVAYLRRGNNRYPLYAETPHVAQIPKSIGFPIPAVISHRDQSVNHQGVCFTGRTSGLTVGHVRSLRTVKIFRNKSNIYQHRAFWSLKRSDGGRARKGDSGAWVYETTSGKPILLLVGVCGMDESLAISLEEVFTDIMKNCGKRPALHVPVRDRYSPDPTDDDLGLIRGRRLSM